jgi:hypothetical protein
MPSEQSLTEMQTCQVASLAVGLCLLQEGANLLDTASTTQELNELRQRVEVIRILFKQLAVSADGIFVFVIDKHQVSVHESSLLI